MATDEILEALADACDAASSTLRERAALIRAEKAGDSSSRPLDAVARARALHQHLGKRQAEIVKVLEQAGADGTNTGVISREIGYGQPNVYLTLRGLSTLGFVEKDETTDPHTYRLAPLLTCDDGAGEQPS